MTPSVVFTTPGELPEIAITTLGINAKDPDSSPIGFFGTGLKYAIAIILREHEKIEIHSGDRQYSFFTEDIQLRGKEFSIVKMCMRSAGGYTPSFTRLGFTTELGKNWKLWMAYRELYSNTLDEHGFTSTGSETFTGDDTTTRIIVTGPKFAAIHASRHQWFLDTIFEPLVATDTVQIYDAPAKGIFYRNILVHERPTLFTYNFLRDIDLTEDRTVKNNWTPHWHAGIAIVNSNNEKLIRATVCAPKDTWDSNIEFDTFDTHNPSHCPTLYRVIGELYDRQEQSLRDDVKMLYLRHRPVEEIQPALLSKLEQAMLNRALACLATLGVTIPSDMNIVVTETLEQDNLGEAKQGTIFLSRRAFHMGTKMLAGTIYEEWIHLTLKHYDCSRAMQNYLIDKIMSLAEELRGAPI